MHGPRIPGPCMSMVKPALSTQSDFTVALATIDRPAVGRLKRDLGVFAALGAYGRKHLAREPIAVTTISVPLCLPCLSARRTALGLISIALGLEELLVLSREAEVGATIGTPDGFVLKTHWMTSFLKYSSWGLGHPILDTNLIQSNKACNNLNLNYWIHHTPIARVVKSHRSSIRALNPLRAFRGSIQPHSCSGSPSNRTETASFSTFPLLSQAIQIRALSPRISVVIWFPRPHYQKTTGRCPGLIHTWQQSG